VASHALNRESSRSHAAFTVQVEHGPRRGRLTFVDLAGSERLKETKSQGKTLKETAAINKSLFHLGNVISALSDGKPRQQVPFRESKLTKLLISSLEQIAVVVACVSPSSAYIDETKQTLDFALRAQNIVTKPVQSFSVAGPGGTAMPVLKREIHALKHELAYYKRQVIEMGGSLDFLPRDGDASGATPAGMNRRPSANNARPMPLPALGSRGPSHPGHLGPATGAASSTASTPTAGTRSVGPATPSLTNGFSVLVAATPPVRLASLEPPKDLYAGPPGAALALALASGGGGGGSGSTGGVGGDRRHSLRPANSAGIRRSSSLLLGDEDVDGMAQQLSRIRAENNSLSRVIHTLAVKLDQTTGVLARKQSASDITLDASSPTPPGVSALSHSASPGPSEAVLASSVTKVTLTALAHPPTQPPPTEPPQSQSSHSPRHRPSYPVEPSFPAVALPSAPIPPAPTHAGMTRSPSSVAALPSLASAHGDQPHHGETPVRPTHSSQNHHRRRRRRREKLDRVAAAVERLNEAEATLASQLAQEAKRSQGGHKQPGSAASPARPGPVSGPAPIRRQSLSAGPKRSSSVPRPSGGRLVPVRVPSYPASPRSTSDGYAAISQRRRSSAVPRDAPISAVSTVSASATPSAVSRPPRPVRLSSSGGHSRPSYRSTFDASSVEPTPRAHASSSLADKLGLSPPPLLTLDLDLYSGLGSPGAGRLASDDIVIKTGSPAYSSDAPSSASAGHAPSPAHHHAPDGSSSTVTISAAPRRPLRAVRPGVAPKDASHSPHTPPANQTPKAAAAAAASAAASTAAAPRPGSFVAQALERAAASPPPPPSGPKRSRRI
jgi:hypothetical protein